MISPEQLIRDYADTITKLREDLAVSEQNVKDFERLALTWQKSYNEEVPRLKAKIKTLEGTIEELERELRE